MNAFKKLVYLWRQLAAHTFVFGCTTFLGVTAAERPNIIFMLSDDQAWNGLSVAMHPTKSGSKSTVFKTPHLEKFAAEGIRFSAAYAPAPVCSPTRISLQTGMNNARLQWTKAAPPISPSEGYKLIEPSQRKSIRDDETTIGELLQQAGYATAHYGKWHLNGGGPESHGYDESDGETGNSQAFKFKGDNPVDIVGMGTRATAFMKKSKEAEKPFFIQMSYNALHAPQNANPKTQEMYKKLLPHTDERGIQRAAITTDLDTGVGQVLKAIDDLDLRDNTYVIYMSDNGSGGGRRSGDQALNGGKGDLWEGGIRVPLIIRGPGIKPNSWCHQQVVGYDFLPTFCQLAEYKEDLPDRLDGGSITHLLNGSDDPVHRPRKELVFHFPHYQGDTPHSAIFLGEFKAIHFFETGETKLFNLIKDIGEKTDLAKKMPEKTAEMQKLLSAYLKETNAQIPTPNPNAIEGKTYTGKGGRTRRKGARTKKR